MSRFSPTQRSSAKPGGLGGLAAALQQGVEGFQAQRDRQEGQRNHAFAQNVQRGGLLERGISIDTPEEPEGFGSAFVRALSGAPAPQPVSSAPAPGAFDVTMGEFQTIDPITKQPKLPIQRSGNVTYDPNMELQREMASATAKGNLGLSLGEQQRGLDERRYGSAIKTMGGNPLAGGLPGARDSFFRKEQPVPERGTEEYLAMLEAEAKARRSGIGGGNGGAPLDDVMRLRTDYRLQPAVKNARTIQTAYQRIKNTQDNAVGDLSLIFAYMKMLDPESVVRETEFANAQNAAGVPDRVRNIYNRVMEGERLNPNQRAQFRSQAEQLARGAQDGLKRTNAEFRRIAQKYGVDVSLIFTDEPDEPNEDADADEAEALLGLRKP